MRLSIRPGALSDATALTDLANDHHEAFTGEPLWSVEEIRALLVTATADPTRDDRFVERDGVPVAGFHTRFYEPFDVGRIDLAVPLQDERAAVVEMLVDAALRVLRARSSKDDAIAQATVPTEDAELIDCLQGRGFAITGRLWLLEIPAEGVTRVPPSPSIDVSTLDVLQHLSDGFEILEQSFPTPGSNWHLPRDDYEHMMRNDPTALAGLSLIAHEGARPVGVCINFLDTMRPQAGHIGMLGVARSARRRGIARALFTESLARFAERGWTHGRLTTISPVDGKGGEDAAGFFRSVGMQTVYDHDILARPLVTQHPVTRTLGTRH
ncbi:MAG: GNAT family N-acetyltransferase [Actinomycetia bacterium]|nr:GNAT family N-acetyltransferase [Actinomycetes bacterium]